MAIYANGPDYQTYSVGTAPTQIFYTRGFGGTAIAGTITTHNPIVTNSGTVALYVGGGTIMTSFGGTSTALNLINNGVVLQPGQQLVIFGTAVTSNNVLANTFDLVGCTAAVTTTVQSGYATQTIVS